MTHDAEMFLLREMDRDDLLNFQDYGNFNDIMDESLGIDIETGEIVDEDAGMLFPQPLREYDVIKERMLL